MSNLKCHGLKRTLLFSINQSIFIYKAQLNSTFVDQCAIQSAEINMTTDTYRHDMTTDTYRQNNCINTHPYRTHQIERSLTSFKKWTRKVLF